MRRRWLVAVLVIALLAGFAARTVMKRMAATEAASTASAAAPTIDLAATDVARAITTELTRVVEVSGGLKALGSALVKARIAAEVESITVRAGEAVRAGQVLARLDDTEAALRLRQAENQAAAARSQLDLAQRTLADNKALVEQGFISKNALDTSAMTAAGAQASLQAARAAAELARKSVRDATVTAPIDGIVSERFVQPGERVNVDAKLLEIVDLAHLELEAALAPEDAAALRVGQRATLRVEGFDEPFEAAVVRISPSTQAGTRAVLAYLQLKDSAPGLRQGLFARGVIELQRRAALVVPASAVRVDQAEPYVLEVRDGKVEQTTVTTGQRGQASFGGRGESAIEITAGVQAGATVVRATVGALRGGTAVALPSPFH